jgi:hypothetical protein
LQGEGQQFIRALQEIRDRARGHGYPAVAQVLIEVRDTLGLRIAQGASPGDDIEAKLVLG